MTVYPLFHMSGMCAVKWLQTPHTFIIVFTFVMAFTMIEFAKRFNFFIHDFFFTGPTIMKNSSFDLFCYHFIGIFITKTLPP